MRKGRAGKCLVPERTRRPMLQRQPGQEVFSCFSNVTCRFRDRQPASVALLLDGYSGPRSGLVATPLRLAGNAITVTINFHAGAVIQIKRRLFAGVHLIATGLSLALKPRSAVALCRGLVTSEKFDVTRFLGELLPPIVRVIGTNLFSKCSENKSVTFSRMT